MAEDAVQSALAKAYASWHRVSSVRHPQASVRQRAINEDLSERQIAEVLGCSRGTVKSQASDALSALRRRYAVAADLVAERDSS